VSNAQAIESLSRLQSSLRKMGSRIVANRVAKACAPVLTALVAETFDTSEDAYGNAWSPGAEGQKITLRQSGRLAAGLVYTAIGTVIRLKLAAPYAKYQVGRRPVAPTQGGKLPVAYSEALARVAVDVCREEMG